jgi:nitrogen PTS system EIIA component
MRLRDHISKELIFIFPRPGDKRSLLEALVRQIKEVLVDIDEEVLLQRLLQREEEVSTGIGHGVAIPHAFLEGLNESRCVLCQIPDGVDFQSLDASPVHVVFVLLSPPGQTGNHIRLLARIARKVAREHFVYRLATAQSTGELYSLLVEEDQRHG